MKKLSSFILLVFAGFLFLPMVYASDNANIKNFIKQFTDNVNTGSLESLNQISSSNIKLVNNLTTYMDSFKLEQDVTKIKEQNNKYIVTTEANITYSGKENKTKLEYEIIEDPTSGLAISSTNLFDKIGHGSLISNVKSGVIIIIVVIIGGIIFIYYKRKKDLKELNHMRKSENSTGLGGMMDHH